MSEPAAAVRPQVHFDDVREGDAIPALHVRPDPVQLFMFSAATYNAHRIHYDRGWAQEVEGYDDLVVHGPLQTAWMTQAVTDWIGGCGRLVRFAAQSRGMAVVGEPLVFEATITAKRSTSATHGEVDLALQGRRATGELVLPGTATVVLPRRES